MQLENKIEAIAKEVTEWAYISDRAYDDPFNDVELDVLVKDSGGACWRVPAYWAGGQEWRVRFSAPRPGEYEVSTICSDPANGTLHGVIHSLKATPYAGDNPLLEHGLLRIGASRRTFEHADGTPFFWLGDTWWMSLCDRLSWPEDFHLLADDRKEKGFSVIQLVAGLYPDMPEFDERGNNEAGLPWETDYARINPAYFDYADQRMRCLVETGLVPCILGSWGFYLLQMGETKMKQHWRYLIARWSAYPVVWCLAGEASMPYYLSQEKEVDQRRLVKGWTDLGRYVHETDPYSHLITIHPPEIGRDQVEDERVLDFDMLQTGHGGLESVGNTVAKVSAERNRKPAMPVVVGEVNYEGIIHGTQAEVQRLTFWAAFLSGAAGYTYGANGIWQVNTAEKSFGPSPHGGNWGNTPWDEAFCKPGSFQVGLARELFDRYAWWLFEPRQEWVNPSGSPDDINAPFAAGIPGEVRIIYLYRPILPWLEESVAVVAIEPDVEYQAFFWNPRNGEVHEQGRVVADAAGRWCIPLQPTLDDWVLVLEGQG